MDYNYTLADQSLILFYSFDSTQSNATRVVDESSGGTSNGAVGKMIYNGTVLGGNTTYATGTWRGNAMQFDGTDDYINVSNFPRLPTNLTVTAWVNPLDITGDQGLVTYTNSLATSGFVLAIEGNQKPWFSIMGTSALSPDALTIGTWNRLDGVYDGEYVRIYVNGVLKKSTAKTGGVTYDASQFHIGTIFASAPFWYYGALDEVQVWNRSMTANEIQGLYNNSLHYRLFHNSTRQYVYIEGNYSRLAKGNYTNTAFANCSSPSSAEAGFSIFQIHPTIIQCFDESNPNTRLTFNVTVSSNSQYYLNNSLAYFRELLQAENGELVTYTISETAGNYYPRTFLTNASSPQNLSFYLLRTTDGQIVRIKTLTSGDLVVTGVTVNVYKTNGTGWVPVSSQVSDSTGTATFFLSPVTNYRFTATKTGYAAVDTQFVASSQDYRLYLTSATTSILYGLYENISVGWSPDASMLNTSPVNQTVSFSIKDSGSMLKYYGLYVYYNNTLISFQNTSGDVDGGVTSISLNTTLYSKGLRLDFVGFFAKANSSQANLTRTYGVGNLEPGANSLYSALRRLGQITNVNLGPVLTVFSLLVVALVSAWLSQGTFIGGGVVGLVLLGIFTFMNIITWEILALTALALGAVLYLRGRI